MEIMTSVFVNKVEIFFNEISNFLKNSIMYEYLIEINDNNNKFSIEKKYYKEDLTILNIDDFVHLLHTFRFWDCQLLI